MTHTEDTHLGVRVTHSHDTKHLCRCKLSAPRCEIVGIGDTHDKAKEDLERKLGTSVDRTTTEIVSSIDRNFEEQNAFKDGTKVGYARPTMFKQTKKRNDDWVIWAIVVLLIGLTIWAVI